MALYGGDGSLDACVSAVDRALHFRNLSIDTPQGLFCRVGSVGR